MLLRRLSAELVFVADACDAVAHGAHIYITTPLGAGDGQVRMLTSDGSVLRSWGSYGTKRGEFTFACGIAVLRNTVFVSDPRNHRIQAFQLDGTFKLEWGCFGADPGQFSYPVGLCVSESLLYVADYGNARVQAFTTAGAPALCFQLPKTQPLRLRVTREELFVLQKTPWADAGTIDVLARDGTFHRSIVVASPLLAQFVAGSFLHSLERRKILDRRPDGTCVKVTDAELDGCLCLLPSKEKERQGSRTKE